MTKPVVALRLRIRGIRSLQISPNLVASVKVLYEGQQTPIDQLVWMNKIQNAIMVNIEPWRIKEDRTLANRISTALSNQGMNACVYSKESVRVTVEKFGDKQGVLKFIKECGEEAKIAVRNIRKKYRQKNKPDKKEEKEIQKITDGAIKEIESIVSNKVDNL